MRESIRKAFEGDEEIVKLYDPTVQVSDVDQVVEDIYRKLVEYDLLYQFKFVEVPDGYFCYMPGTLVSFGLSKQVRTPERLTQFWEGIVEELGGTFDCMLWSRNTRGIRWLQKMGMRVDREVEYEGNKITVLCL